MYPASNTNWHASGIVIKYLVISGWVTVIGPPDSICFLNLGITEPLDPKTFPNLVVINFVLLELLTFIELLSD